MLLWRLELKMLISRYLVILLMLVSVETIATQEHALSKKDVYELQEKLSNAGFTVKYFDGILGRETEIAIELYANQNKILGEPEVVLAHIRKAKSPTSDRIKELEEQLAKLKKDVSKIKAKTDTDVEKPFFTPSRDIPNLIQSESKQSDIEIYKTLALTVLVSIIAIGGGAYWLVEHAKEKIKKQLEDDLKTKLNVVLNRKLQRTTRTIDKHVSDSAKEAMHEHYEDYGEITGRLSYFLYEVKDTLSHIDEKLLDSEDPIKGSVKRIKGTIQKTQEVSNFAAMETILKLPVDKIKSNEEILLSITNGLYYLAEDIHKKSMVLRTEVKAKTLIKSSIEKVENIALEEMAKDKTWLNIMDNLCFAGAVSCEYSDEKLINLFNQMEAYIQSDAECGYANIGELLSVYPERVRKLMEGTA